METISLQQTRGKRQHWEYIITYSDGEVKRIQERAESLPLNVCRKDVLELLGEGFLYQKSNELNLHLLRQCGDTIKDILSNRYVDKVTIDSWGTLCITYASL